MKKIPEFYMIIARKIFFRFFGGKGHVPPLPPGSYAYDLGESSDVNKARTLKAKAKVKATKFGLKDKAKD